MKRKLFVVTPATYAEHILKDGIRCNANGEIWLFEGKRVSGYINDKQVFIPMSHIVATYCNLKSFAVICVDSAGIGNATRADKCKPNPKQLEAFKYLWVAKQLSISPLFLKLYEFYKFGEKHRHTKKIEEKQSV